MMIAEAATAAGEVAEAVVTGVVGVAVIGAVCFFLWLCSR